MARVVCVSECLKCDPRLEIIWDKGSMISIGIAKTRKSYTAKFVTNKEIDIDAPEAFITTCQRCHSFGAIAQILRISRVPIPASPAGSCEVTMDFCLMPQAGIEALMLREELEEPVI